MKRLLVAVGASVCVLGFAASPVSAQSGHFIQRGAGAPECRDIGNQVECTGKVAGLGGTTFEITVEATGVASVVCINPGGNRAPGQDTTFTVAGTTDPLPTPRNGQSPFEVDTDDPAPLPPTPTCPNEKWSPEIVDVSFTTATLRLFEDGVQVDEVTVTVTSS